MTDCRPELLCCSDGVGPRMSHDNRDHHSSAYKEHCGNDPFAREEKPRLDTQGRLIHGNMEKDDRKSYCCPPPKENGMCTMQDGKCTDQMCTGATDKKYFCCACGMDFKTKKDLDEHDHGHSQSNPCTSQQSQSNNAYNPQAPPPQQQPCNSSYYPAVAHKSFSANDIINNGQQQQQQQQPKTSYGTTMSSGSPQPTTPGRSGRPYYGTRRFNCSICFKDFSSQHCLDVHNMIHTGRKPYDCEICGKAFRQQGGLTAHIRIHTGEKPYTCDICDRPFRQQGSLTAHMRIHTGEKPFKCEICHKDFRQRGGLTAHARTHTGEKPYKCEVCGDAFSQQSGLMGHAKIHTGDLPYKCDVCSASFKRKSKLKTHMVSHKAEQQQAPHNNQAPPPMYHFRQSNSMFPMGEILHDHNSSIRSHVMNALNPKPSGNPN